MHVHFVRNVNQASAEFDFAVSPCGPFFETLEDGLAK
jgi:hypothetical protein